jgi:hypothetical protein
LQSNVADQNKFHNFYGNIEKERMLEKDTEINNGIKNDFK